MKIHYKTVARKNKKLKSEADRFDKPIDDGVMLLLVNEYMLNVCRRWQMFKQKIYDEASKVLKQIKADFEYDHNADSESELILPSNIVLSEYVTREIFQ